MSVRIFKDIEEGLSREIRRITFHDNRTQTAAVLQDQFDPLTGELVQSPIEPKFTDASADARHIQYPHFFIKVLKTFEDRFTGRAVPQYGKLNSVPLTTTPKAYEIVVSSSDGTISAHGAELKTSLFQIAKVAPGYLLRILNGNNVGTYIISSINKVSIGQHSIFVENTLLEGLPNFNFDESSRVISFNEPTDLNTIKVGDIFIDADSSSFSIEEININTNSIVLGDTGIPSTESGATIERTGDVFQAADSGLVRFLVLDPSKPVKVAGVCGDTDGYSGFSNVSAKVPVDAYYLVRIDSKERKVHIEILNRMWEEFNPPRTGLPVIVRTKLSYEQTLTQDVAEDGSQTLYVEDNSKFNINDHVFVFDDFIPTKNELDETFKRPFSSKIIGLIGSDQVVLEDVVPDTFKVSNCSKIVSNAEFQILMFHFRDHSVKDIEGSNYWIHEFIFWIQFWVDRLGEPSETGVITGVDLDDEDLIIENF